MRTLKIGSLVLVILACCWFLQQFVLSSWGHETARVRDFYAEEENTIDVVLLGASEVFAGFSSVEAYAAYGFTSYPYVIGDNPTVLLQSELEAVLQKQKPKLMVVEVNPYCYGEEEPFNEGVAHFYLDYLPWSAGKAKTILQTVPSEHKEEYFIPLLKNHDRWTEPNHILNNLKDFSRIASAGSGSKLKGIATWSKVDQTPSYQTTEAYTETMPIAAEAEAELRELLSYCKEQNLQVIFTRFPHKIPDNESTQDYLRRAAYTNEVARIVREYGFDFYNYEMQSTAIGLDEQNDFYDSDHLNVYGMEKFTKYFGNMLQTKYGITATELTTEQKARWDSCIPYLNAFLQYDKNLIAQGQEEWLWETSTTLNQLKIEN